MVNNETAPGNSLKEHNYQLLRRHTFWVTLKIPLNSVSKFLVTYFSHIKDMNTYLC